MYKSLYKISYRYLTEAGLRPLSNPFVKLAFHSLNARLAVAGITLLQTMIVNRFLLPYERGLFSNILYFFNSISLFACLSANKSIFSFFNPIYKYKIKEFVDTSIYFSLWNALAGITLSAVFIFFVDYSFSANNQIFFWGVIYLFLNMFISMSSAIFTMSDRLRLLNKIQIATALVTLCFVTLFLGMGLKGQGAFIGVVLGMCFFMITFIRLERVEFRNPLRFSRDLASNLTTSGLKLHIVTVMISLNEYFGPLYMAYSVSLEELGYYSVALSVGTLIGMISISFQQALYPALMKTTSKGNSDLILFIKSQVLLITILMPIIILISIFSDYIILILAGQDYEKASSLVWIIGLGCMLQGIRTNIAPYMMKLGHRTFLTASWMAILTSVASLVFNFILIPKYQGYGCAIALLLTNIIGVLFGILFLKLYVGKDSTAGLEPV